MKFQQILLYMFAFLFSFGCSGSHQETEYQKIREMNKVSKKISRRSEDVLLTLAVPKEQSQSYYPWQESAHQNHPYITKEFFRCKGQASNPSFLQGEERLFDCIGSQRHSLPLNMGKEFVYPILIDLLNFLQNKLDAKVVITCGHRCPQHNRYSDISDFNKTSKHMIGAEVDFYVEGYEKRPEKVVEALISYYSQEKFNGNKGLQEFKRYTKPNLNVSTHPWYNQEVFIKLYKKTEGRDKDNNHSFPYLSIQVRNDLVLNESVTYTWQKAFYNYLRY